MEASKERRHVFEVRGIKEHDGFAGGSNRRQPLPDELGFVVEFPPTQTNPLRLSVNEKSVRHALWLKARSPFK
jgi:hypothetical protein